MITKIGGIRASSYSMLVLMAIVTIFTLNYDFASAEQTNFGTFKSVNLPFVENQGQFANEVAFYADTFAGRIYVVDDKIRYSLSNLDSGINIAVDERFLNGAINPEGAEKSTAIVNYYVGDRENWRSNLPTYNSVYLGDVWQNVSVELKAHGNNIEKIFTIRPGGSVENIRISLDGVLQVTVNDSGQLVLKTELGDLVMSEPVAYQEINGVKKHVNVSYVLSGSTYGFEVGDYDKRYSLVIDPLLESTFIGGSGEDVGADIEFASGGTGVVIVGGTTSTDFPGSGSGSSQDIFVSKLDLALDTLVFTTIYGGTGDDIALGVAVNGTGHIHVTGNTAAGITPLNGGASYSGAQDGFLLELEPTGEVDIATNAGGTGNDFYQEIVHDAASGDFFVTGYTDSAGLGTPGAYQEIISTSACGFVARYNDALIVEAYTYLCGTTGSDVLTDIALGSSGDPYVVGYVTSTNFPVTSGSYTVTPSVYNIVVAKLANSLGTGGYLATYVGPGLGQTIDASSGYVAIAGFTDDPLYPVTTGVIQDTYGGGDNDGVVTVFTPSLIKMESTFFGGSDNDRDISDLDINSAGTEIGFVGRTSSSELQNFPVTPGAYDTTKNIPGNSFQSYIAKVSPDLSTNLATTYIGDLDGINAVLFHPSGEIFVAGSGGSAYPTAGTYQDTNAGGLDAVISVFSNDLSADITMVSAITTSTITIDVTFSEDVTDDGDPANWSVFGNTVTASANFDSDTVRLTLGTPIGTGATPDVTYTASGSTVKDSAGNEANSGTITPADGIPPTVVSITPSEPLLSDPDVDIAAFTVTVVYSEPMDGTSTPTLGFTPDVTAPPITLTFSSGSWTGLDTYAAIYDVADAGVTVPGVDIEVSGAEDAADNVQTSATETNAFDIDTENPTKISTVIDGLISDADVPGPFTVTTTFSETMDTAFTPTVAFAPDVTAGPTPTLTFVGGAWSVGDTVYTTTYSIADAGVTVADVDVTVSDARDLAGNLDPGTTPDLFDIDTENPVVTPPPNVTFAATSSSGAIVTYGLATATDTTLSGVGGVASITSLPPSGSVFPIALNTITHTAIDTAGNVGVATSTANVFNISFDGTSPFAVESALYLTVKDAGISPASSVTFTAKSANGDPIAFAGISISAAETAPTSDTFRNAVNSFVITQSASNAGTGKLNVGNSGYDTITVTYTSTQGVSKSITAKSEIAGGAGAPATSVDPMLWSSDTYVIGGSGTPKVFDSDFAGNDIVDTIPVTVSSSADGNTPRSLTLVEDDANSGTFSAASAIVFSASPAVSNLGVIPPILLVAVGGTIDADYDDTTGAAVDLDALDANIISDVIPVLGVIDVNIVNNVCGEGNDDDNDGLCDSWEINSGRAFRGLKILRADSSVAYSYACRPLVDDTSFGVNAQPAPNNVNVCPNSQKRDVYLEIDYMIGHKPLRGALDDLVAAFAAADVTNPDGSTGITAHIQLDESVGFHSDSIPFTDTPADDNDYYELKGMRFGKASERGQAGIDLTQYFTSKRQGFHYVLFGHNYDENPASSGHAEILGNDVFISLGNFEDNVGSRAEQGRTLMHELGHNLGLNHGGRTIDEDNCKPNYLSIMNYAFQLDPFATGNPMDYSRSALPTLDEFNLNEVTGLGQATPTSLNSVYNNGLGDTVVTPDLSDPSNSIDWNGVDGPVSDDVEVDIGNMGTPCPDSAALDDELLGYDDWAGAQLNFRGGGEFSDGVFTDFSALSETDGTANFLPSPGALHNNPVVDSITAPTTAFNIGLTQPFSATFVDPDGLSGNPTAETWTAVWDWGDGSTSSIPISGISITNPPDLVDNTAVGTISSPGHKYATQGKYVVSVTVTDSSDNFDTSTFPVPMMVRDAKTTNKNIATATQVSPAGSLTSDLEFVGTSAFNFQSQYTKGKAVGNLVWDLKRPDGSIFMTLRAKSFEWMISDGAQRDEGYIKGKATLTGMTGDVGFVASFVDGNIVAGSGNLDKLGLRIYSSPSTAGSEFDINKIIYANHCPDRSPTPEVECKPAYSRAELVTSTGTVAIQKK